MKREKYSVDVDQSIHNVISKLRKYLNRDEQVRIDTVRYEGYQLTIS
ncbi:hypothetical protein [Proteiniphilum sp. X52]|nr:hypothetical protein [Proteiniphilum sp. X52]RNC67090.1 hypothetical protein D7D25_02350 [Proteiniphilum sp. X52]